MNPDESKTNYAHLALSDTEQPSWQMSLIYYCMFESDVIGPSVVYTHR